MGGGEVLKLFTHQPGQQYLISNAQLYYPVETDEDFPFHCMMEPNLISWS